MHQRREKGNKNIHLVAGKGRKKGKGNKREVVSISYEKESLLA